MKDDKRKKIQIFPNPQNAKVVAHVTFSDVKTGEAYIEKEYSATKEYYRLYQSAMTLPARAYAFKELSVARVAFAHRMGYHPEKVDPFTWTWQGNQPKQKPTVA